MTSHNKMLIAPLGGFEDAQHVQTSWASNLIEEGVDVVSTASVMTEHGDLLSGEPAISVGSVVIPHAIFNTRKGYPMNFATLGSIQYALDHDVPLFSEIPLADHLERSKGSVGGNILYSRLQKLGDGIGETVIGQDISAIQMQLGAI